MSWTLTVINIFRYYREGSRCEKCDSSCELCSGPGPDSCRVCSPPLLELQGTKLCVERCPHRFYQHTDVCKQCHTSCQTCTGTDKEAIVPSLSCSKSEQYLFWAFCSPSLHLNIHVFAGASPQECVTCDWGSTLNNNVCYPRCEEGRYFSVEVCVPCHPGGHLHV